MSPDGADANQEKRHRSSYQLISKPLAVEMRQVELSKPGLFDLESGQQPETRDQQQRPTRPCSRRPMNALIQPAQALAGS